MKSSRYLCVSLLIALSACSPQAEGPADEPGAPSTAAPEVKLMGPHEFQALSYLPPDHKIAYGDDATQIGELRVPEGTGPFPVVILIHGGCWREPFANLNEMGPIGDVLKAEGIATWNIEYRRLPQAGSGWPGTYLDIANGVDHLRALASEHHLDLNRVVIVGHSAGGHLAMWAASRSRLDPKSAVFTPDPLKPIGVINLAGTMDMSVNIENMETSCQAPVVHEMLGGSENERPDRYRDVSAFKLLPIGVRQVVILGEHETFIPHVLGKAHVDAAVAKGDDAELLIVPGAGHFEIAATSTSAWPTLDGAIRALVDGKLPARQ